MFLIEGLVENNGEGKENGVNDFKQKEFRKTVVTRVDIVVNIANEVFHKEEDTEGTLVRHEKRGRGAQTKRK